MQFRPVPLYTVVPAGQARAYYSKDITRYTRIAEIYLIFPAGTLLNLTYQFFLCSQPQSDLTLPPNGTELTGNDVAVGYFPGDNIAYSMPFQYDIPKNMPYLALYATNGATAAFTASAIAIMELDV